MNTRTWSMIISILLVGVTLVSLCISYLNYKNDIAEFNKQEEIRLSQEDNTEEIDWDGVFDSNPDSDIDDSFNTKLVIHSVIIGFIFLAEIGMLIVLPKKNSLNS